MPAPSAFFPGSPASSVVRRNRQPHFDVGLTARNGKVLVFCTAEELEVGAVQLAGNADKKCKTCGLKVDAWGWAQYERCDGGIRIVWHECKACWYYSSVNPYAPFVKRPVSVHPRFVRAFNRLTLRFFHRSVNALLARPLVVK